MRGVRWVVLGWLGEGVGVTSNVMRLVSRFGVVREAVNGDAEDRESRDRRMAEVEDIDEDGCDKRISEGKKCNDSFFLGKIAVISP